jgi:hypothetical protein
MINLIFRKRLCVSAGAEFTFLDRQTVQSFRKRGTKQNVRGEECLSFPGARKKSNSNFWRSYRLLRPRMLRPSFPTQKPTKREKKQKIVSVTTTLLVWWHVLANFGLFRNKQIRAKSCDRCDVGNTDSEKFLITCPVSPSMCIILLHIWPLPFASTSLLIYSGWAFSRLILQIRCCHSAARASQCCGLRKSVLRLAPLALKNNINLVFMEMRLSLKSF